MANEVDTNTIIANLTELMQNSVNMTSVFYDIFINPVPMDVTLTQYNEDGELITVTVPNRAKDMQRALVGIGNPEGRVEAPEGTLYVDQPTQTAYVKTDGNDTHGWKLILTEEGVYAYVRSYLATSDYIDTPKLNAYLINNSYTTEEKVEDLIASSTGSTWVYTLPTSGTVLLEDGKTYKTEATDNIAFVLPNITDLTKLHKIMVQLKVLDGANNVSVGTSYFFNAISSDFSRAGIYDIRYEYDNLNNVWVCGVEFKGLGSYISLPDLYDKVDTMANNLVTTINADSTDLEYPSARCVWNLIQELRGN